MPLLWISLAFMAGIVAGASLHWTLTGWIGLAASLLLARAFRDTGTARIIAISGFNTTISQTTR